MNSVRLDLNEKAKWELTITMRDEIRTHFDAGTECISALQG